MRACMVSKESVREKIVNDKILYDTNQLTRIRIENWQSVFTNVSFFFTNQDNKVCQDRIEKNLSDFSCELYPLDQLSDESSFFIHVPASSMRISMMTGYDVRNITTEEVASALYSFNLLEQPVYGLLLLSFILFILFIVIKCFVNHQSELLWLDRMDAFEPFNYQPLRRMMRRNIITQPGYIQQSIHNQINMFLRNTTTSPKFICISFALLTFYLMVYFMAIYSTSSIIVRRPFQLNTYEKLAKHPNASVYFIRSYPSPSDSFKNAPINSWKNHIWHKFSASSHDQFPRILQDTENYFKLVRDHQTIIIGPYPYLVILAYTFCAFRSEDEIRHMVIMTDPSEYDRLIGFPLARHLKNHPHVLRQISLASQSGLLDYLADKLSLWVFETLGRRENITKQRVVCIDDVELAVAQLQPVTITFWISFFYASIAVVSLACIILLLEHFIFQTCRLFNLKHARGRQRLRLMKILPRKYFIERASPGNDRTIMNILRKTRY